MYEYDIFKNDDQISVPRRLINMDEVGGTFSCILICDIVKRNIIFSLSRIYRADEDEQLFTFRR